MTESAASIQPARALARLLGFAAPPLISLLAPVLVLPIVAAHTSVEGWAALATGQSFGSVVALVAGLGWQLSGPIAVTEDPGSADRLFFESLMSRGAVLTVVIIPSVLASAFIAPDGQAVLAATSAAAYASTCLSSAWLSVGLGRPKALLLWEALPKVFFSLAAGALIAFGLSVEIYPALQLVGTAVAVALFARKVVRPRRAGHRKLRALISRLAIPTAIVTASGLYTAGAMLTVSLFSTPQVTAHASSADRLFRISLFVIVALGSALQSWVAAASPHRATRRRQAVVLHASLGVVGGVALGVLLRPAARILFGSAIVPPEWASVWYGVAFAAISISTTLGQHILLVDGRARAVLHSTIVGAAVGLPLIAALARIEGAAGAAAAIAIGEVTVVGVQLGLLGRAAPPERPGVATNDARMGGQR